MLDIGMEPSASISGTYPNLILTLNIPYGKAPEEPEVTPAYMYIGAVPYDESGVAGFDEPEEVGAGITEKFIKWGLDGGNLQAIEPQTGTFKVFNGVDGGYICAIIPASCGYTAYVDNGVGTKVKFTEYGEGGDFQVHNEPITSKINGTDYVVFGMCSIDGNWTLYVE